MDPGSPLPYVILAAVAIGLITFSLTWNRRSQPIRQGKEETIHSDRSRSAIRREGNHDS